MSLGSGAMNGLSEQPADERRATANPVLRRLTFCQRITVNTFTDTNDRPLTDHTRFTLGRKHEGAAFCTPADHESPLRRCGPFSTIGEATPPAWAMPEAIRTLCETRSRYRLRMTLSLGFRCPTTVHVRRDRPSPNPWSSGLDVHWRRRSVNRRHLPAMGCHQTQLHAYAHCTDVTCSCMPGVHLDGLRPAHSKRGRGRGSRRKTPHRDSRRLTTANFLLGLAFPDQGQTRGRVFRHRTAVLAERFDPADPPRTIPY